MDEEFFIPLTNEIVEAHQYDQEIIKYIKNKFKNITNDGAKNLINLLMRSVTKINIKDISNAKRFIERNKTRFDEETNLIKIEVIKEIYSYITNKLLTISSGYDEYDPIKHKNIINNKEDDLFIVNKNLRYKEYLKKLHKEDGDFKVDFDFLNTNLKNSNLQNTNKLQKCIININSTPIRFDYPIEYKYNCPRCGHKDIKKAYEVVSTAQW